MGIVDDEFEKNKPPPFDPTTQARRGLALPPPLTEREREIFRDIRTLKNIARKLEEKIERLEKPPGTFSTIRKSFFGQRRRISKRSKRSKRSRRK